MFQSLLLWNGGADPGLGTQSIPATWCFNPCCCGTGGRTMIYLTMRRLRCGFQSLLLWNGGADSAVEMPSGSPRNVSILVVVERGGGLELPENVQVTSTMFQSLLLWNGGADLGCSECQAWLRRRVSILVVVERGGGRRHGQIEPAALCGVSILVVVERGGGLAPHAADLPRADEFQSLLLWNGGADDSRQAGERPCSPSFNPCCCGTGGRTLGAKTGADRRTGFNPCCCGTGGRTFRLRSDGSPARVFQSLLLWNGEANAGRGDAADGRFLVSILVVVERGGGHGVFAS